MRTVRTRPVKQIQKINPLVLQVALIALLVAMTPTGAQTDSTTASTTTTTTQAVPKGSEFNGIVVAAFQLEWTPGHGIGAKRLISIRTIKKAFGAMTPSASFSEN